jgi:hypothetical protein
MIDASSRLPSERVVPTKPLMTPCTVWRATGAVITAVSSASPETTRGVEGARAPASSIARTMRRENTSPSSREFEASRFAPCRPDEVHSPDA